MSTTTRSMPHRIGQWRPSLGQLRAARTQQEVGVEPQQNRPRWASIALAVRTAVTTGGLVLLLGFGALSLLAQPPAQPQEIGLSARPLDHLMTHNRCSYTGFDSSVIPSKAIVRDTAGRTRLVSFDAGWAVFTGKRSGELVAVCLGPKRAG